MKKMSIRVKTIIILILGGLAAIQPIAMLIDGEFNLRKLEVFVIFSILTAIFYYFIYKTPQK